MAANNFIEYHKTDLHERLLRSIALSVELLNNNKDYDVSEYDIQAIMSQFLKRNFINTNFRIYMEKYGKFDCAISEKGLDNPKILYELKTYIKPMEKLNTMSAYKQILHDLSKL